MELGALQFPAETRGGMCSAFAAVLAELSHKRDRDGWHPVVGQDRSTLQMSGRHRKRKKRRNTGGESQRQVQSPAAADEENTSKKQEQKSGQRICKTQSLSSHLQGGAAEVTENRKPPGPPGLCGEKRAETKRPHGRSRLWIGGFAAHKTSPQAAAARLAGWAFVKCIHIFCTRWVVVLDMHDMLRFRFA